MIKRVLWAIVTLTLAMFASVAAPAKDQGVTILQVAAKTASTTAIGGRVPVMQASELIDRTVYDEKAQAVGVAKFMLFNTETGNLSFLLFSPGGPGELAEPEGFIAVPWTNAKISIYSDNAILLDVSKSILDDAAHFTVPELAEITKPVVSAQITEYFAPVRPTSEDSETTENSNQPVAHLLVGGEIVTRISGPGFAVDNQIAGSAVYSNEGSHVGDIDQVVVDLANGQLAYVLIDRDTFLGLGGDWVAMPFPALTWTPDDDRYSVDLTDSEFSKLQSLPRENLPTYVKQADIADLYDKFDLEMY